jgi:hypothetical protein
VDISMLMWEKHLLRGIHVNSVGTTLLSRFLSRPGLKWIRLLGYKYFECAMWIMVGIC